MEIWKPVVWLEWIEVSSDWRVRRILTQSINSWGYKIVTIADWKTMSKQYKVNRLVASAFHWLDLNNSDLLACHKDDDPSNNKEDNIFIGSHVENMKDMFEKWRTKWGEKLTEEKVVEIRKTRTEWHSINMIAKTFWVNRSTIERICLGITW